MAFPNPTKAQILAAFKAHGVNYKVEPVLASQEGRLSWGNGLRALVDHHTAGTNSMSYLMNKGGTYPYVNSLISRDGVVHVLCAYSCWGTGNGGPWSGVAAKDSLHLVAWSTEVEDLGQGKTFTNAQMVSLGKQNAALISLGVPAKNEINHRDWTDGTGGVGGYPLPTRGRKIDTRYTTEELRANTAKYGGNVALTDAEIQKIADRVWAKKFKVAWDGNEKAASSILTQTNYHSISGGYVGTVPATATSRPGLPTTAKQILDASLNDSQGVVTPPPGTVAISEADKADIAKRVADELYKRMQS
jgi:hypothetical protein